MVIVDNTFATPMLWKPLDDGLIMVITVATKYLSGHGNLTAGVICGNDSGLMQNAVEYRKFVGHMLSPDDAYRLQTQMASFALRFRQQCDNAAAVASLLESSERVTRVLYPGLESHETHAAAKELTGGKGYGAMITFDLAGATPRQRERTVTGLLQPFTRNTPDPTLGTIILFFMRCRSRMGHNKYTEPGMIRLSVVMKIRQVKDFVGAD